MRIAIISGVRHKLGGVETYFERVVPAFVERGHTVGFWSTAPAPVSGTVPLALPKEVMIWDNCQKEVKWALASLADWKADFLYVQGVETPELEERLLRTAPALLFIHNYYGSCISGTKTHLLPTHQPCNVQFGPACLLRYYPHRCGGLNPLTMWRQYRIQSSRLGNLSKYASIAVASEHMAGEYRRLGLKKVEVVPYPFETSTSPKRTCHKNAATSNELNLLFLGRMDRNKGGDILIKALPDISAAAGKRVICHFAGDGDQKNAWFEQAGQLSPTGARVQVVFHGWISRQRRDELLSESHLLVVPSIWPEPYALVGLEAAAQGVPAVAFDVGGIRDWLVNGRNGILAPGDPPTVDGLTAAVLEAIRTPEVYAHLCKGARARAHEQISSDKHVARIEELAVGFLSTNTKSSGNQHT